MFRLTPALLNALFTFIYSKVFFYFVKNYFKIKKTIAQVLYIMSIVEM